MARDACKVDRCVLNYRQLLIFHQLMDETGLTLVETLSVEGDRAWRYSPRDEPILQPCTKDLDGLAEQKNRSVPW